MVSMVRDVRPEQEAGLLVGSRQWPLLAARMQNIGESDGTHAVARHLNRLTADTSWKEASGTALVGRLVDATPHSLTTPSSAPPRPRPVWGSHGRGPFPLHHPTAGARSAGPGRSSRPHSPTAAAPSKGAGRGR